MFILIGEDNTISTGMISMSYTEPTNALILENALPMSDQEGKMQGKYFEFTVTSHATTNVSDDVGVTIPYEINISEIEVDSGMTKLPLSAVKINLVTLSGSTETEVSKPKLLSRMTKSTLRESATRIYKTSDIHKNGNSEISTRYRLRAWIDKNYLLYNDDKTEYQYKFKVNVNSHANAIGVNYPVNTTLLLDSIMEQGVVTSGNGLYESTKTNNGSPTYYYRGNVENNYIELAGLNKLICTYKGSQVISDVTGQLATEDRCESTNICAFVDAYVVELTEEECTSMGGTYLEAKAKNKPLSGRVIRINEDGTIRIILTNVSISSRFNSNYNNYKYMYYSESAVAGGIKKAIDDWYNENLASYKNIAKSTYCEQAKVKGNSTFTSGNATMATLDTYVSDFKCKEDGNGYGLLYENIGLITVDELIHAGGIKGELSSYYLSNVLTWTMSPAGFDSSANGWFGRYAGAPRDYYSVRNYYPVLPVISLIADTMITGEGTNDKPWIAQMVIN